MKLRKIYFIAMLLIFLGLIPTSVFASKVNYNGEEWHLKYPIAIENGVSYMSLEDYTRITSMDIFIDTRNRAIHFSNGNTTYKLDLNDSQLHTPSSVVAIQSIVANNQLMLPIRQMNMAVGLYTAFDFNTNTVLVADVAIQDIPLIEQPKEWQVPSMIPNPTGPFKIPILCYHVVTDGKAAPLYIPNWRLDEHLKTLKKNGYTAITPQQLYEAYYFKKPLPNKPILITFDDGYYDNYSLAYPVLKSNDMQATIFIIGSYIHDTLNYGTGELSFLSWENIKEMQSHVTFQNHTYNSHYKDISPKGKWVGAISSPLQMNNKWETIEEYWIRIGNDFKQTEDLLKHKLGYGSYIFSYPYGEYSHITTSVLQQLGIPLGVTVTNGVANQSSAVYELPRIAVEGTWTSDKLMRHINRYSK